MGINLGSGFGNLTGNSNSTSQTGGILNLNKNDILDLTKRNPGLKRVKLGAGWDISNNGFDFDLDIAAFLLDSNNKFNSLENIIFFNNKQGEGIYLEGVKTLPCKIKVVNKDIEHKTTMLKIKLVEGKNRQVKKMFESVGHPVKRLHRISVGCVNLKGLRPGEYRRLKPQEVKDLKKLVGK